MGAADGRMQVAEMESPARERLLEALLDELADNGPAELDVMRTLRAVGVSPAEFEIEFADLESALKAAYGQSIRRLLSLVEKSCSVESGPWPRRVAAGLEALIAALAGNPQMAQAMVRRFPAMSPATRTAYECSLEEIASLLREGREWAGGAALPAEVEMFAVGSAESIVADEVERDRAGHLLELIPELLFSLLVPFIGPSQAIAEMEAARHQH